MALRLFLKSFMIFLLVSFLNSQGQPSYFLNGAAKALGNECYAITPADSWQNGSVWYARKLDLRENIDIRFDVSFGNNDAFGADGMVLVLQTAGPNALGDNGEGMGFSGFNPALGIEFDVFSNWESNDPSYDHLAILSNGIVKHNSSHNLAGPTGILSNQSNVEDGRLHHIRLRWISEIQQLEVYFDCEKRLSIRKNLVHDIFQGNHLVYWGFTAATGKYFNEHKVCLDSIPLLNFKDSICEGETITLKALDHTKAYYIWRKGTETLQETTPSIEVSPTSHTTFSLLYPDQCGDTVRQTHHIVLKQAPAFISDTFFCSGDSVELSFTVDSVRWFDAGTQMSRSFNQAGRYSLQLFSENCSFDRSVVIHEKSRLNWDAPDTALCRGETLLIALDSLKDLTNYRWSDGYPNLNRPIHSGTKLNLKLVNACGSEDYDIQIRTTPIQYTNLPADTGICAGDSLRVLLNSGLKTIRWSDGLHSVSRTLTEEGWWRIEVTDTHGCLYADSMYLTLNHPPRLLQQEDLELCKDEELQLEIKGNHLDRIYRNNLPSNRMMLINGNERMISIRAENQCGSDSIQFEVAEVDCHCHLIFANAFTPNMDGLNEAFKPAVDCEWQEYHLEIYNRWGELIYSTQEVEQGWSGKHAPAGVYFYKAHIKGKANNGPVQKQYHGLFHLIK